MGCWVVNFFPIVLCKWQVGTKEKKADKFRPPTKNSKWHHSLWTMWRATAASLELRATVKSDCQKDSVAENRPLNEHHSKDDKDSLYELLRLFHHLGFDPVSTKETKTSKTEWWDRLIYTIKQRMGKVLAEYHS